MKMKKSCTVIDTSKIEFKEEKNENEGGDEHEKKCNVTTVEDQFSEGTN